MPALNTLDLIIDITAADKQGLLLNFNDRQPASVPLFVRDDEVGVTLRFVQPSTTDSRAWDDVDLSADTVKLALGVFDTAPTSGSFTLTYGAEVTTEIAFDASANDVQMALNSLSTIGTGGVTVTKPKDGVFYVTWANVGTRTAISGTATGLTPASSIMATPVVDGAAAVREIQVIQIRQDPYALTDTWTEFPTASATVSIITAGTVSSPTVQRITLDPDPYAGTFQITTNLLTTAAIDFDASAEDVEDALNTGGNNYIVTGDDGGPWTITTVANGSVALFTVNSAGLSVPVGLSGSLELSTYSMLEAFINGDSDITLEMQVQVTPSGSGASTVLQVPVTASKDVINLGSMTPTPQSEYYTKVESDARFEPVLGNPSVTGYVLSSTTAGVRSWIAVAASTAWGAITGTLSNQADLQSALNAKQDQSANLDAFSAKTAPTGDVVGTSDGQTLTNKTLTNPTITNYTESVVAIGTVTTTHTLDLTSGTVQTATLTASTACTFTMPTATAGKSFTLLLKQAASTGNGTATFTGVKWNIAGAPTMTTTAGSMDIFTFTSDGTNWYGATSQGYTP